MDKEQIYELVNQIVIYLQTADNKYSGQWINLLDAVTNLIDVAKDLYAEDLTQTLREEILNEYIGG